jgi:hypothetical protein
MAHRQALFKLQKPSSVGWLARVSRGAKFDQDLLHGEVEQGGLTLLPSEGAQKHTLDISNISSAVWHPSSPLLRRGNVPRYSEHADLLLSSCPNKLLSHKPLSLKHLICTIRARRDCSEGILDNAVEPCWRCNPKVSSDRSDMCVLGSMSLYLLICSLIAQTAQADAFALISGSNSEASDPVQN